MHFKVKVYFKTVPLNFAYINERTSFLSTNEIQIEKDKKMRGRKKES